MMRYFVRSCLVLAMIIGTVWADKPVARPIPEFNYFYFVFKSMADPDLQVADSAHFATGYAAMFGLSDAEIKSLGVIAEEFRESLIQTRGESDATYSSARAFNGGELSSSDQESLGSLEATFHARVEELGEQFLKTIRPESAGRIRTVLDTATAEIRGASGVSGATATSPQLASAAPHPLVTSLTLTQWEDCIQGNVGNYGSTCSLAAGTYNVSATIPVWRSNITVSGSSTSTTQLTRVSPWPVNMLQAGDASHTGVTNVTFSNLTFEGNAQNMPALSYEGSYADLYLGPQFGAWNLSVSNCTFDDSPTFSIYAWRATSINSSWFNFNTNPAYAGFTAVLAWNSSSELQADAIQVTNSYVYHSGLNAIYFAGAEYSVVEYDWFYGNHQTCFGNASGGQIAVTNNAGQGMFGTNNVISFNYADGEEVRCSNGYVTNGVETYGINYTVQNNTLVNHLGAGVAMSNSSGGIITGNTIKNNGFDGIALWGDLDGSGCVAKPSSGVMYTITSNTITGNGEYSIEGTTDGCASGPFQTPFSNSPPTTWDVTIPAGSNTMTGNHVNTPDFHN